MKKLTAALALIILLCLSAFAVASANVGYEYYYRQLDANQKAIYRAIVNAPVPTLTYSIELPEDGGSREILNSKLSALIQALQLDHPESMAWLTDFQESSYDKANNTFSFTLYCDIRYNSEDQIKAERLINTIVAAADPSWDLYTKAMFISNAVRDALVYDWNYPFYSNGEAEYYMSTILCINNGYAVCGGFSKLYKVIADRIGLPCVEVNSTRHAWVHVQMEDGKWYGVEPQNPLYLQGTKSMLNNTFSDDNTDQYKLYNGIFGVESTIRQPERTTDDYEYTGVEPNPGSVDLTPERQDTTEMALTYTVNKDGKTCTITGSRGKQTGDLIIPTVLDGYTVTAIGPNAFTYADFDGVLTLPDTVEVIGNQAFAYCTNLKGQLVLPADLRTIGSAAFIRCSGFTGELVFNDKLESIGRGAFGFCSGLTGSLMLPDSIISLDNDSFYDCPGLNGVLHIPLGITDWSASYVSVCTNLTAFDISPDHPSYIVVDGILYSKDMTRLVQCPTGYSGAVVIPEGVTTIGSYSFFCCVNVTSLSFPSTLMQIEKYGCSAMKGIEHQLVLPPSLVYFDDFAFDGNTGIRGTLIISPQLQLRQGVFKACQNIKTVIVEEGVTSLPDQTFDFATGLERVYFPSTITSIGVGCFRSIHPLGGLRMYGRPGSIVENYVNSIDRNESNLVFYPMVNGYAFSQQEIKLSVLEPDNNSTCQLIIEPAMPEETIIWASADESVAIVEAGVVTAVGPGRTTITATFCGESLECIIVVDNGVLISADGKTLIKVSPHYTGELVIPEGIEVIDWQAMYQCHHITALQLPSTLKHILGLGCAEMTGLTGMLTIPVGVKLEGSVFSGCSNIEEIVVEEGVTSLPNYLFELCLGVKRIFLPSTLKSIGAGCFFGISKLQIYGYAGTVAEDYVNSEEGQLLEATFHPMVNGYGLSESKVSLSLIPAEDNASIQLTILPQMPAEEVQWLSADENVAKVEDGLVTAVSTGQTVITATFGQTTLHCPVTIHDVVQISADGKTLIKVSESFEGELVIPEGVETIRSDSIQGVYGLTKIVFPSTLKKIEDHAFWGLGSGKPDIDIILPDGLESVGKSAFAVGRYDTVWYPGKSQVGSYAFSMCEIGTLSVPEGVTTLPEYAFTYSNIRSCYLPASLTSAPLNAFEEANVEMFIGYSGTFAERYVKELQATYPDRKFEFICLGDSINPNEYTLKAGETVRLIWKAGGTWTSNNEAVATVDSNGLVIAWQEGTATITATTPDGASSSCQITVITLHTAVIAPAVPPTCTAAGLTEGEYCSVCGEVLVAQTVIPAKGHAISLSQTHYEMVVDETLTLADFIIACGHEGAVTLTGISSDETKVVLEGNTLYAKGSGRVHIDVTATLPDGFGSRFTLTIDVRSGKTMMLPALLIEIGEEAFMGVGADEFILQEGITSIGPRAFADSNVRFITIPASVIDIAEDAFEGCDVTIIAPKDCAAEAFALEHEIPYIEYIEP